ncbi:MAG TPA: tRNA 2-selenouridine(34) synthase MnmH [Hanamia sp.]|nr:tRNA 2-selenouridine(34) synthase MnmH [Hanamia sp.]
MPIEKVDIEKFLRLSEKFPILDVRSPAEFAHAHIPNAFSVPIFSDEERKIIGTAYKKQSRQLAVNYGLNFFSERMKIIPREAETLAENWFDDNNQTKTYLVHCWRGGMRSEAVAWLLSLYGYKVFLLKGGYKSFRRLVLDQFEKEYTLKTLGGFTGSGKTQVLKELSSRGEKVIDLEGLANHKGSAFGALGENPQPSSEMFENELGLQLWQISANTNGDGNTKIEIWLEDESAHIGTVGIPKAFWQQMRKSPLYFLDIPFEKRLENILKIYGTFDKEELVNCIFKIQKRLGGLETKNAIHFINENKLKEAFEILLKYYDKFYEQSLFKRENVNSLLHKIECGHTEKSNASFLLE